MGWGRGRGGVGGYVGIAGQAIRWRLFSREGAIEQPGSLLAAWRETAVQEKQRWLSDPALFFFFLSAAPQALHFFFKQVKQLASQCNPAHPLCLWGVHKRQDIPAEGRLINFTLQNLKRQERQAHPSAIFLHQSKTH